MFPLACIAICCEVRVEPEIILEYVFSPLDRS